MKVIIAGAAGRMGQELIKYAITSDNVEVIGATEHKQSPWIGKDVGELINEKKIGIEINSNLIDIIKGADAVIDFTNPQTTIENSILVAQARISHIIGTTGFSDEDQIKIENASRHAVIVQSGNMSLGINILSKITKQISKVLKDFDIEIIEAHHNKKIDAPSGTALLLGKSAAAGRNIDLDSHSTYERFGDIGVREDESIGFSVIRGGNIIGEHTVMFAGDNETIKLSHSAMNRKIFVRGAYHAAKWSVKQKPGLYSMDDVLDFD